MTPMRCPVCPNPDIPADQTACANCGADVTSIRKLQELPARLYNEALVLLQRGENERAVAKLSAANELDPQSEPIRALLEKTRTPAAASGAGRFAAFAAVIILALVAAGAFVMSLRRPLPAPREEAPTKASLIPETVAPPALPPALPALQSRLAKNAGIKVAQDDEALHITFNEGLFPSGSDVPTEAGRATLVALARELDHGDAPEARTPLRVEVEGFTDSNPPPRERWSDNWSLAFSRAQAAVELMRGASADIVWSASSSGDRDTPYPHDGEANQSRNRTVVLHVTPRRTNG